MPYIHGWVYSMEDGQLRTQIDFKPGDEFSNPVYKYDEETL
jgi:carbonic anhydrase